MIVFVVFFIFVFLSAITTIMADRDGSGPRWSGQEIYKFLGVYQKHEELWDTCNEKYPKKNARQISFKKLVKELIDIGYEIPYEEYLRKKIKNIKDVYRNELNKVNKSLKSGTGDVYEPKLRWFNKADSFLKNAKSGRESTSNLDDAVLDNTIMIEYDGADSDDVKCDYVDDPLYESSQPATTPQRNTRQVTASSSTIKQILSSKKQPPKKKFKRNSGSVETKSVEKVNEAPVITSYNNDVPEDEYDRFAMHIACQLRQLSTRSFIIMQEKIQSLITQERLDNLVSPNESAPITPSYSHL